MTNAETVYVTLLDEGVDVWRPVLARRLEGNAFAIIDQPYDRDDERWQFEPGARVVCEERVLEGTPVTVAIARAQPS